MSSASRLSEFTKIKFSLILFKWKLNDYAVLETRVNTFLRERVHANTRIILVKSKLLQLGLK